MKAGLGIIRKNNFLYTEQGSFVMLEGFVIDESCKLRQHHDLKPCAPQCRLCQDHCPTRALSAPFTMNPLKCVSFWNTFGKSQLPPTLPEKTMGSWVVGCDACQNACPYNRIPAAKPEKETPEKVNLALPWLDPERLKTAPDSVLQDQILPYATTISNRMNSIPCGAVRPVISGISKIAKVLQLLFHAIYEDFFFRIAAKEVTAVDRVFCHEAQVVAEKIFHVFIRIVKEDSQPPRPALKGIEDFPQDLFRVCRAKGLKKKQQSASSGRSYTAASASIKDTLFRAAGLSALTRAFCHNRSSYSMPIERQPV